MTASKAFLLGILVAWSPTLLLLAWVLYRDSQEMADEYNTEPD